MVRVQKLSTIGEVSDKIRQINAEVKDLNTIEAQSKKAYENALQNRRYYAEKVKPYKKLKWLSLTSFACSLITAIASFTIITTLPVTFATVLGASLVMGTCSFLAVKRDFNKIKNCNKKYKYYTNECVKNYKLMESSKERAEYLLKVRKEYTLQHLGFMIKANNEKQKAAEEQKRLNSIPAKPQPIKHSIDRGR